MSRRCLKSLTAILMCATLVAGIFSGCADKNKPVDFIYPFNADVNSYDPQVAATADEFLIIENTFEGLIRIDDSGNIIKGCADSWSVSDDGLNYRFSLRHGLRWNINTERYETGENKGKFKDERLEMLGYEFNPEITAEDFVFALRRAALPETNAPLFPSIASIRNAPSVNSGRAEPTALGVKAEDKYTLLITLSSKDENFMQTLSSSIAMPCNEEFFNATKGRYGLDTAHTLFNGQFYVDQILKESFLLKKNELYCGEYPANAGELTLKIINPDDESDAKKNTVARLKSGYYDAAFITGAQSGQLSDAEGISYVPYQDTTWVLLLNNNNEIFRSKLMRSAFCIGMSRLTSPELSYTADTRSLLPESCSGKLSKPYYAEAENTEKSVRLWKKGLDILGNTDISITIITTPEMQNSLKAMLQGIQSGISTVTRNGNGDAVNCSVKVLALEKDELDAALIKKEYDAAFYPYKSGSGSAIQFLKVFSEKNRTGFASAKFDRALADAETASSPEDEAKYVMKAQEELLKTYSVYPLLSETSYYAAAKGVSGIRFHAGSGRVSFVNATRVKK